jgi:DNA-binding IclR family transcriptional regulator
MSTQVLTRTTQLLRQLAISRSEGLRLVELCRLTGLERGTVHRLLKDLIIEGLVSQDQESKVYFLGLVVFEMGMGVPAMSLRELCNPHLSKLSEEIGETTVLTVKSGNDGVCIDIVHGRPVLGETQVQGARSSLINGVPNLAILSGLPAAERQRVCLAGLQFTDPEHHEFALATIEAQILRIQAQGYAFQGEGEVMGGACLAMGLVDQMGTCFAAIGICNAAVATQVKVSALASALRLTLSAVAKDLQQASLHRAKG